MKKKIGITIEEMLVNAILNPDKKFRHKSWQFFEYIRWDNNGACAWFVDEVNFPIEWTEIDCLLTGWEEYKGE